MDKPRNLRDGLVRIVELEDRLQEAEATIAGFSERMDSLEHAQNHGMHAARKPPRIPPFPKALEDIGLRPPKRKKVAA